MQRIIEIDQFDESNIVFSICTLVTDIQEYEEMLESFNHAGFNDENSEFIYVNNINNNKYDAYDGLNKLLNTAKGKYIILCHQDILLKFDNYDILIKRIDEIEEIDSNWAVLANAGYKDFNKRALRITDPWGKDTNNGPFPAKVKSVDENFILVKNESNLAVSSDIGGFHLYGTDLCQIANILGYSCYVIDFHLFHKSGGNVNEAFYNNKERFIEKYSKILKTLVVRTPVTPIFVFSFSILNKLCNRKICYSIRKRWDYISAKFK